MALMCVQACCLHGSWQHAWQLRCPRLLKVGSTGTSSLALHSIPAAWRLQPGVCTAESSCVLFIMRQRLRAPETAFLTLAVVAGPCCPPLAACHCQQCAAVLKMVLNLFLCIVLAVTGGSVHGRKVLQCIDSYPACAGWGKASCIYPGVPTYCPCMCGAGPGPVPKPSPSPAPTPGPCQDSYPACPGWGAASCIFGGVPQLCPCMCGGGNPPTPTPSPPPQPLPSPSPPGVPGIPISTWLTAQVWDQIFANRNNPACKPPSGAACLPCLLLACKRRC